MNEILSENKKNLSTMIAIIKIAIIAFVGIILYLNLPYYGEKLKLNGSIHSNLYASGVLALISGVLYISWSIINRTITQSINKFKVSWLLETFFYTAIILLPAFLSANYDNEYKYLFILLITAVAIQYGSKYGIITSLFSAVIILAWDLLMAPTVEGINLYFQKDIIIMGIFIFISWVIGFYVDLETEKEINKEKQIEELSSELKVENVSRCNMEEALIKNKICYDILFENSQNAILVHQDGKIIYANESAAKLLKYENSMQLNEYTVYKHYSEADTVITKEKYVNIINNKLSKVIYEEKILDCAGKVIDVRNTSSFFIHEGKASVVTFLFDITPEKQIETLKQDAEMNLKLLNETNEFNVLITEFFTNISHEIKTPVNVIYVAIQGISMYLENYNSDNINKCKSYLITMKQNCLRMIRLINNLLDITKSDSGFITPNKKNGNIVSVVEDITQSVVLYIKSRNIQLIFDTNVEEKIMAFDYDMIERIMLNLISNAFKYSHSSGRIYINIEDKGSTVVIKVKDQGDGIPADKLDVIFERFGQANRSLHRKCEGTGIGLYLVKSFVEMHDGKISVISKKKEGSEFKIVLPVELVNNEKPIEKEFYTSNVERINIEFSDIYTT